jgi:hypothetical protein
MEWQVVIAIVIAIPVILFPAAFVWYMNIGGIVKAFKKVRMKKASKDRENNLGVAAK